MLGQYQPATISANYPFMHRGWFEYARDYPWVLGQTNMVEQQAKDLLKKFALTAVGAGVIGYLLVKHAL